MRLLPVFGATLIVFGAERGISSRDPPANAVQPRIDHSFGNIDIIQLIADFQLGFLRNDDLAARNMLGFQDVRQQNRRIGNDVIAGPFFIVGEDGDEFRSLTDEEVKESLKRFAEPEEISQEEVENALSAGVMFFG